MSHAHRRALGHHVPKSRRLLRAQWRPWNHIPPLWADPWHPHKTYPYPYHGVAS